jgi:hypothetical protein
MIEIEMRIGRDHVLIASMTIMMVITMMMMMIMVIVMISSAQG